MASRLTFLFLALICLGTQACKPKTKPVANDQQKIIVGDWNAIAQNQVSSITPPNTRSGNRNQDTFIAILQVSSPEDQAPGERFKQRAY